MAAFFYEDLVWRGISVLLGSVVVLGCVGLSESLNSSKSFFVRWRGYPFQDANVVISRSSS